MSVTNVASGQVSDTVEELIGRRQEGFSLEAPFYNSQEFFDLDMTAIFGQHWLFVAAEAEIAEPGDFVTVEIGRASLIVVRDDDESVRAMYNVCRHRGARILEDRCGAVGNLVCPYHQWTYRTDGSLIYAENQAPDLDKSRFGLTQVHVRVMSGLVFVCLAEEPPSDFDEMASVVEPYLRHYQLEDTSVAHQIELIEEGNWKLVMENNRECQHCDASHPELLTAYFPFHRYSEDDVTPRMRPVFERYQAANARLDNVCQISRAPRTTNRELEDRATAYMIMRLPLDGDGASFGVDGAQVCAKLLGEVPEAQFGDLSLHLQPNAWFHFLGDHAVLFSVLPISPTRSVVRTTWLVHPDAVAGEDYDVDTLTRVWRQTNDQDRALVQRAQLGVLDEGYQPGPYAIVEDDVEAFVKWYIGRLNAFLAPHAPLHLAPAHGQ